MRVAVFVVRVDVLVLHVYVVFHAGERAAGLQKNQ